jgi:peptidoglycan glycosyltransferase
MLHRPIKGSSLTLTIDSGIQRAAVEAMAGRPGAVVVLDGKTGAVLAMASAPGFDPNQITNTEYAASLPDTALLNRVTQGLYTPGSTFKLVTMIAGLDSGAITPRTVFDFGEPKTDQSGKVYYTLEVNGGVVYDANHKENRLDLKQALVYSANVAFAKVALDMNPDTYIKETAEMGFDTPNYAQRYPLELPVAAPQLANNIDNIRTNDLLRAHTGYGQGELLTTPLNMAMVVEAIVNDGTFPVPYMVEAIRDPQGNVVSKRPSNHVVRNVMRPDTAQFAREAMIALVQKYWGDNFVGVPGVTAGGKTGTAQLGGELEPHFWFIGFTQKGDREVVIAVMLENAGGTRTNTAVTVFQAVATAAMAE